MHIEKAGSSGMEEKINGFGFSDGAISRKC